MGYDIETLQAIVAFMIAYGKPVSSAKISRELNVSQRTVQRYLRLLEDAGFVEAIRKGKSIKYVLLRPLTDEEAKRLVGISTESHANEPEVYALARRAIEVLKRDAQLPADLLGAAKVHLAVPEKHHRITHDIDIVVPPELLSASIALLKVTLGLIVERSGGIHTDAKLHDPSRGIKVDLIGGKLVEEGRVVLDLSEVLRKRGELTLEEAIVAKMTRRAFSYRNDAYDVAVALPVIDEGRWRSALELLKERGDPLLIPRLFKAIEITRGYVKGEMNPVERPYLVRKLEALERVAREVFKASA
jgi:DNA-binding transcriptional ArsR family regulator